MGRMGKMGWFFLTRHCEGAERPKQSGGLNRDADDPIARTLRCSQ